MSINVSAEAFRRAVLCLQQGGVIAYPTEGVYGLGCDAHNDEAIKKVLSIKNRNPDKGLILIAASLDQIKDFMGDMPQEVLQKIMKTWPGPNTWVVPANNKVSPLITGKHQSIALRVTAHPQASELCQQFGGPIISTSANREGDTPAINNIEVYELFRNEVDYILPGRVGDLKQSTTIIDALTDEHIR